MDPALEDVARLHLDLMGKERVFEVRVPLGQRTPLEVLPAARQIAQQIADAVSDESRSRGQPVSCGPNCGACCRQLVPISPVEAQLIAGLVARMPPERQKAVRARFAEAVRQLEDCGLLDRHGIPGQRNLLAHTGDSLKAVLRELAIRYWKQQIPCPFLENESCSIHADRPLLCVDYLVRSAASMCSKLYEEPVDRVEVPVSPDRAFLHACHDVAGHALVKIPLVLALEWSEHRSNDPTKVDAVSLLQRFIAGLDREYERSFDDR